MYRLPLVSKDDSPTQHQITNYDAMCQLCVSDLRGLGNDTAPEPLFALRGRHSSRWLCVRAPKLVVLCPMGADDGAFEDAGCTPPAIIS